MSVCKKNTRLLQLTRYEFKDASAKAICCQEKQEMSDNASLSATRKRGNSVVNYKLGKILSKRKINGKKLLED
jgi:hypothetical protein